MKLFESVNRLLQDKYTLTEAKTVLRVTFDNGMKKDIEFKGSFEAGKKAYLGKNVKAISKDKTPVMLKAVKVEPINESKDLEPMKTFKVTYHDGSSYKTSARAKSEEDFKKYLTQDGPWVVTDEDDETGKETKKKIVKVEILKESLDNQTEKIVLSKSLPAYFEAMLWSSNDQDDNPLDKNYSISDISDKLRESSKKDLLSFVEKCEKECSEELEEYISDKGREKFGHDFWLSRNGHGAGFFDDGFNKLQKLAKSFKEVDVYVTDDGEIDA